MINVKFKCIYLGYLICKSQRISITINIFLAVVSISSFSAWAIWKILPGLFTTLLAISNILMAIKPILSYDKRIKELSEKLAKLEDVHFDYEKLWYQIETNGVNENDASKCFFEIYERQKNSLRTSTEIIINTKKKIVEKSNLETDKYIVNHYGYKFSLQPTQ